MDDAYSAPDLEVPDGDVEAPDADVIEPDGDVPLGPLAHLIATRVRNRMTPVHAWTSMSARTAAPTAMTRLLLA